MNFYADLHIHSKWSRACSQDCDLEHLSLWAQQKASPSPARLFAKPLLCNVILLRDRSRGAGVWTAIYARVGQSSARTCHRRDG